MSFASIFSNIWSGVKTFEPIAAKLVPLAIPASGPIFTMIDPIFHAPLNTVIATEIQSPGNGLGTAKLDASVAAFANQDLINQMKVIAAASNLTFTYDESKIKAGLSAYADAMNLLAEGKASMKFVPISSPPPAQPQ